MRRLTIFSGALAVTLACAQERSTTAQQFGAGSWQLPEVAAPSPCLAQRPHLLASVEQRSGTVAIAQSSQRTLAIVADSDERALHTVDVNAWQQLAVTPLAGTPSQVVVLADGRVAVTLRDQGQVVIYEAQQDTALPLQERCSIAVPREPIAMALAADSLIVTSGWAAQVTALDATTLTTKRRWPVAQEPRAVVVSERTAFVTHSQGGTISAVPLDADEVEAIDVRVGQRVERDPRGFVDFSKEDKRPREANQGFSILLASVDEQFGPQLFAPMTSVDPGGFEQPVTITGGGYGGVISDFGPPIASPFVSLVDPASRKLMWRGLTTGGSATNCTLPRAVTMTHDTLFVTCLGIDAVVALDAHAADPVFAERYRFPVPAGPTGIAAHEGGVVVWSQFDKTLSRVSLHADTFLSSDRLALARRDKQLLSATYERGRKLFHSTIDGRISNAARACASCHPDGRTDGLTWSSPDGPRQTVMLAGRLADTAPYGWFGEHETLDEHLRHTVGRLGGGGFDKRVERDARDLDALIEFIVHMPVPDREQPDSELMALGKALFDAPAQGCGACHTDGGTDGAPHDVGSGKKREKRLAFDTPSLRYGKSTAPFFHDGRHATLRDVLSATDGFMGHTSQLDAHQREALLSYLEAL